MDSENQQYYHPGNVAQAQYNHLQCTPLKYSPGVVIDQVHTIFAALIDSQQTNPDHKIPGFKHAQVDYRSFDDVLPVQK